MKKIAIVGCTGAVGQTMLNLLDNKNLEVTCMASDASVGREITIEKKAYILEKFSPQACADSDIVFLCVSGSFSKTYAKELSKNSYVIDNSSAFRYDDKVPLLVPYVNGSDYKGEKLIANPNCSSAIALMVLGPLHEKYELESIIVSTYQAASGAGKSAMSELREQTGKFVDYGIKNDSEFFPYNLAFNVIPQVDKFEDNLYTKEEMKVVWEVRKVLNLPDLKISTTAVRVPTIRSHAESLSILFKREVKSLEQARHLLQKAPGVEVVDDVLRQHYPMPMNSTYKHNVEVGRIRYNLIYGKYGLDLFISGDQLLRGAALNAYEIMELLRKIQRR